MFINYKTTKESETEHWHLKFLNLYPLLRRALRITDQRGLDWNLNRGGLEMLDCFFPFLLRLLYLQIPDSRPSSDPHPL